MRRLLTLPLLMLFVLLAGQLSGQKKEILYYVDFCTFYDKELKPYTEMYLNLDASSLSWVPTGTGKFKASALIQLQAHPVGKPEEMLYDKKVELLAGEVVDTTQAAITFSVMDIRRVALPAGSYQFTGTITDNQVAEPAKHGFQRELVIDPAQTTAYFSEIEFTASVRPTVTPQPYSRYGNDILPLITNGSFANRDTLGFYVEAYNVSAQASGGLAFAHAYITEANSLEKQEKYQTTLRLKPEVINPIFYSFDISVLPTKAYYLHIELYNRENKLIANTSRKFFVTNTRVAMTEVGKEDVFNEYFALTEKELDYYLKPMRYVSNNSEISTADACQTFEEKKRYFVGYWEKRKADPNDSPFKPFSQFRAKVNYANDHYKSAFTEGWRTDRGRVMIVHGPPNNVDYFPSDNLKFPHEIWTYNKIETQSNVIFVFYEPMESNNEYTLLHSNLFGENSNPRWKLELVRRGVQDNNLDNNGDRIR